MLAFDALYPEVAKSEYRAIRAQGVGDQRDITLMLRELYCNEPKCDCRRVMLQVHDIADDRVAATINYAFEPPKPPHDKYEEQMFLDPLNPQSDLADEVLDVVSEMIAADRAYHDRLVRHYDMWKSVVDNAAHPLHSKVRSTDHDDPLFVPAFSRKARAEASCGPYEPCPCGSRKKYKFCCRA